MELLALEAARFVVPRRAATVLILRDEPHGPEVLMVRRSDSAKFMPGAYVFPGGAVDALDGQTHADETLQQLGQRVGVALGVSAEEAASFAVAASRECFEECGLWLGAEETHAALLGSLRNQLHGGASLQMLAEACGHELRHLRSSLGVGGSLRLGGRAGLTPPFFSAVRPGDRNPRWMRRKLQRCSGFGRSKQWTCMPAANSRWSSQL